jgi:hypothetical protein
MLALRATGKQRALGVGSNVLCRFSESPIELQGYNFHVCFCRRLNGKVIALRFNDVIAQKEKAP